MSEHLFKQLLEILHEEELLKLRKRCQMQKKIVLSAVLTNELDSRVHVDEYLV